MFKDVPLLFVTQKGRHCIREDDGIFSRSVGTAVLWIGDKEITKDNDEYAQNEDLEVPYHTQPK